MDRDECYDNCFENPDKKKVTAIYLNPT